MKNYKSIQLFDKKNKIKISSNSLYKFSQQNSDICITDFAENVLMQIDPKTQWKGKFSNTSKFVIIVNFFGSVYFQNISKQDLKIFNITLSSPLRLKHDITISFNRDDSLCLVALSDRRFLFKIKNQEILYYELMFGIYNIKCPKLMLNSGLIYENFYINRYPNSNLIQFYSIASCNKIKCRKYIPIKKNDYDTIGLSLSVCNKSIILIKFYLEEGQSAIQFNLANYKIIRQFFGWFSDYNLTIYGEVSEEFTD